MLGQNGDGPLELSHRPARRGRSLEVHRAESLRIAGQQLHAEIDRHPRDLPVRPSRGREDPRQQDTRIDVGLAQVRRQVRPAGRATNGDRDPGVGHQRAALRGQELRNDDGWGPRMGRAERRGHRGEPARVPLGPPVQGRGVATAQRDLHPRRHVERRPGYGDGGSGWGHPPRTPRGGRRHAEAEHRAAAQHRDHPERMLTHEGCTLRWGVHASGAHAVGRVASVAAAPGSGGDGCRRPR